MKKVWLALILAAVLMILAGCSNSERVRIKNNYVVVDNIILAIRHGYHLAEDVYSVADTPQGYDIIIHVEKNAEGEERIRNHGSY